MINFSAQKKEWTNSLVCGDAEKVINARLDALDQAGKAQMVFFDPPYGIDFNSSFLSAQGNKVRAYDDHWTPSAYINYLTRTMQACHRSLNICGSIFIQICSKTIHLVRLAADAIFGPGNFVEMINFASTGGLTNKGLSRTGDYIVWYAKDRKRMIYNQLYLPKDTDSVLAQYNHLHLADGSKRGISKAERECRSNIPAGARAFNPAPISSAGGDDSVEFAYNGKSYRPSPGRHWTVSIAGLKRLAEKGRLHATKNSLRYVRYIDDMPLRKLNNSWTDTCTGSFTAKKVYVVQTAAKIIERCILMSTMPGDIVIDPTAGSGSTCLAAEKWGRRWLAVDSSAVAHDVAVERIKSARFDEYALLTESEGIYGGFACATQINHTMSSIAYDKCPEKITIFDRPVIKQRQNRRFNYHEVLDVSRI